MASVASQAQTLTVLYVFQGGTDGGTPYAGLFRDRAGNLYGTTSHGGNSDQGTVFKLDTTGKKTVLHSFTGGADGGGPDSGSLIPDSDGNLYGTTLGGGAHGLGTVFRINGFGKETVLYSFAESPDAFGPVAGLLRDRTGNLYGTTAQGGAFASGAIFMLKATGRERVLYSFGGGADGSTPYSGLIRDKQGNFYGTTTLGGNSGNGTVFKLDATGKETVLYSFAGYPDGQSPGTGLVLDAAGNLYGTTYSGGTSFWGTVFKLDTTGIETLIHCFTGGSDGGSPDSELILDAQGNLYGTTVVGGAFKYGTVFKIDSTGKETVLHSFDSAIDGASPYGRLVQDSAGNFYGTTATGGVGNCGGPACGTVFKLSP